MRVTFLAMMVLVPITAGCLAAEDAPDATSAGGVGESAEVRGSTEFSELYGANGSVPDDSAGTTHWKDVGFPSGQSSNLRAAHGELLHHNIRYGERDFATGDAVSCSIREGSRTHALLGFTSCDGQLTSLFAAVADPYEVAWSHLPGAEVGVVG